jgi:hypothetical protein
MCGLLLGWRRGGRLRMASCHLVWAVFAAAEIAALGGQAAAAEPAIELVRDAAGRPKAVAVVGLAREQLEQLAPLAPDDAGWPTRLAVRVAGGQDLPPMAGNYAIDGQRLVFTPRFPFQAGVAYRVDCQLTDGGGQRVVKLVHAFSLPPPTRGVPTRVTAVYPSAGALPENQLRFYVHFSQPMSRGEAYEHIRLLRPDGQPDRRALLEIGEELWDPAGQRLTILLDPGRVKQGLKPREEFGPVLEAGKKYKLVVDAAWRDAAGQPLAAGFEKEFVARPAIERPLDPADWKFAPPPSGSRQALVVRFPHPLDHALLQWAIRVAGPDEQFLAGEVATSEGEQQWQFTPAQPWAAGRHALVIDTTLEDTCGNRIGRAFEVDVFREFDKQTAVPQVRLPFTIGGR